MKNEHNHEIVPLQVPAKQILGQMETARAEQNPVNNMIIATIKANILAFGLFWRYITRCRQSKLQY